MGGEGATFTAARSDRLDKLLAGCVPELSRSAAQRLIEQGRVTVNGVLRQANHRVKSGDVIVVELPDTQPASEVLQAEAIALDILYEDPDVLAINKPAGMVVHPGAGNLSGTLVNAVLGHAPGVAAIGDERRPGIVHRLDKETSGIVLVAKTDAGLKALQAQFKSRAVKKLYLALCVGDVQPPRGVIDKPIGRDPAHRQRMAVLVGGRAAATQYAVGEVFRASGEVVELAGGSTAPLKAGSVYSYVRARPATGRTHQLRVHFASLGHPIVGDALYGATRHDPLSRALAPRHLLHASELTFEAPSSGRPVSLHAPLPEDMRRVIDALT